jgi:transcriptional regulator with XRE-family HTH domain
MKKSVHTGEYALLLERLGELRGKAGISQRELGRRLGVPHTWVAKVESGERRIDLIEFGWFCAGCGAVASREAERLFSKWPMNGVAAMKRAGRRR